MRTQRLKRFCEDSIIFLLCMLVIKANKGLVFLTLFPVFVWLLTSIYMLIEATNRYHFGNYIEYGVMYAHIISTTCVLNSGIWNLSYAQNCVLVESLLICIYVHKLTDARWTAWMTYLLGR